MVEVKMEILSMQNAWNPNSCGSNNAMFTTHDWEWFESYQNGDDWGMVYGILSTALLKFAIYG